MAIDDLIAHGFPQQNPEPYTASAERAYSLRGMLDQQAQARAAGQQQLTLGALAIQQHRKAVADDEEISNLYKQMYGGQQTATPPPATPGMQPGSAPVTPPVAAPADPMQIVNLLRARGHHTEADKQMTSLVGQLEKQAIATKDIAEAGHNDAQTRKMKGEAIANVLQGVAEAPIEQQQALYDHGMAALIRDGNMKATDYEPYRGPEFVKQHLAMLVPHLDRLNAEAKQSEAAFNAAVRPSLVTDATSKAAIASAEAGQVGQFGMTLDKKLAHDQTVARDANTARHEGVTERQGNARIRIEAQGLSLRNKEYQQKFGDVLGQMTDNQKALATKLAEGDLSFSQLGRLPDKEVIMAGAIKINPAVSAQSFAVKDSFGNPEKSQAKNLGTISRIVGHIGRFEQNSQQIGFAPAYAAGMNITGQQNKVNEDAHAISAELEKLVSGGVGTQEQIKSWQKSLHSPSMDARQKAVDEISQLIGSQYEGMNQTYKAAIGKDLPVEKYVTPAGRAWMKSKGINVSGAVETATPTAGVVVQHSASTGAYRHSVDGGKTWLPGNK